MFHFYNFKNINYPTFILWMIITTLLLKPYGNVLEPYYRTGLNLIFFYSLCIVLQKWKKTSKELKKLYLILMGLFVFLLCSRFVNNYSIDIDVFLGFLSYSTGINLFTFGLINDTWSKLKGVAIMLAIYSVLNLLTIWEYPDGLYSNDVYSENWLLGFKNVIIRTLLPSIVINMICSIHDFGRITIKDYFLIIVTVISVLLIDSSTSIADITIFCASLLFISFYKIPRFFTLSNAFYALSIVSIMVSFIGIGDLFGGYLERIFGKDATFTGRIFMWAYSFEKILEAPVIGFGWHSMSEWIDIYNFFGGENFNLAVSHPHNYLLYLLVQGGIAYLLLHIYLFKYISEKIVGENQNKFSIILISMYLAFFVEGITESITGAVFFMPMFGLFYHFKDYEHPDNNILVNHYVKNEKSIHYNSNFHI